MKRLFNRNHLKRLVWLLVPLLLWWALRQVSFKEVGSALSQLTVVQIAFLVGLNLFIFFLLSSRWWLISRQQGYPLPLYRVILYRLAAFGFSYYTPGPQLGGLPLQVHLLHKRHAQPTTVALASVTLDKLIDVSVNFTLLLAGIALILFDDIFPDMGFSALILLPSLLFLVPLASLLLFALGFKPFSALEHPISILSRRSAGLQRLLSAALTTEDHVSQLIRYNPRLIIASLGLSWLILFLSLLEYYLTLRYLGISLTLQQAFALLTLERLAFFTPMPAGIGALEAGQVFAISALGYDPALGISASLLIRARDLTLGGIGLWLALILSGSRSTRQISFQTGD